ncbi:MAG: GNAT family N-acetyltransferase [Phycisphaerae bacterium]|nr:GNAT family N-acetyltransferase [Gemmatimonadaceae bacterium]
MTDLRRTPDGGVEQLISDSTTLERGFVASLRWLVAEGDARGVRRIAVELRALQETLATLDETRAARDEQARRSSELERDVAAAIALLGPGTAINGNGSLVARLARLRDRLKEDNESRRQLIVERDAWRSMTTLMTQTRAHVHELLEEAERSRESLSAQVRALRDQVLESQISREHAEQEKRVVDDTLLALRQRLVGWSSTVERALTQLNKAASEIATEHAHVESGAETPAADVLANSHTSTTKDAGRKRVRRTYLQLTSRDQFRPGRRARRQALWLLMPAPSVEEWRHLYATVGAEWKWYDRNAWSDRKLAERLADKNVHVFRADAALNGLSDDIESGVGFVELEMHADGSVEIVYFGLTRSAQGYGLGAWLLERAVEECWGLGATRVWLHTCTLDSPQALPNYLARGFEVEREEEYDAPA